MSRADPGPIGPDGPTEELSVGKQEAFLQGLAQLIRESKLLQHCVGSKVRFKECILHLSKDSRIRQLLEGYKCCMKNGSLLCKGKTSIYGHPFDYHLFKAAELAFPVEKNVDNLQRVMARGGNSQGNGYVASSLCQWFTHFEPDHTSESRITNTRWLLNVCIVPCTIPKSPLVANHSRRCERESKEADCFTRFKRIREEELVLTKTVEQLEKRQALLDRKKADLETRRARLLSDKIRVRKTLRLQREAETKKAVQEVLAKYPELSEVDDDEDLMQETLVPETEEEDDVVNELPFNSHRYFVPIG